MAWLVWRLGLADVVTVVNGVVGFVAGVVAFHSPTLAAQLILLAAIADAVDGIVARSVGNTDAGPLLDSVTDVVSFGVTPALLVVAVAQGTYGGFVDASMTTTGLVLSVAAGFAMLSVVRTALYTTYIEPTDDRPGIQNTLAATIVAAAFLSDVAPTAALLALTAVLAVAMVAPLPYPKLRAGDAMVLGLVQAGAVVAPSAFGHVFPRVIFICALGYAVGAPWFYWGPDDDTTVSRVE